MSTRFHFGCLFLLLFLRILFRIGGCKSSTQKKDKWRLATACQGGTPLKGSRMIANCLSMGDLPRGERDDQLPIKGGPPSKGAGWPSLTPICPVCHTWSSPLRHHCPTQHSDNRITAPVTEDPWHVDNSSLKNSTRKAQGLTLENRTEASDST